MFHWPRPISPWATLPPVAWPTPVTVYPDPCDQQFLLGNPCRAPGTGELPGAWRWACPPGGRTKSNPQWPTHDQYLEAWRAWQRCVGWSDPIQKPLPGRRPPNAFVCPPPRV